MCVCVCWGDQSYFEGWTDTLKCHSKVLPLLLKYDGESNENLIYSASGENHSASLFPHLVML